MRRSLLTFLCLLTGLLTGAQVPEYIRLTDLQSLPCNEIYDIHFDRRGYLWMGTEIGVFRYNGKTYRSFFVNKAAGQAITGITDVGNAKYAHNFLGDVFRLKGDSFLVLPMKKEVLKMGYTHLAGTSDRLWIGTDQGLFYFDTAAGQWVDHTPPIGALPVDRKVPNPKSIRNVISRDAVLWGLNLTNVFSVHPDKTISYPIQFAPGADQNTFNYFVSPTTSTVWLNHGYGKGLYHLRDSVFVPYTDRELSRLMAGKKFTNLKEIQGKLYLMAYNGLLIHDLKTRKTDWLFRDLPITDLEFDQEGNMWLCTLGYGLLFCPTLEIRTLESSKGREGLNKISYVCPARGGGVYFARSGGGIGWIRNPSEPAINVPLPIQAEVSAMWISPDSLVYVSLNNQLFRLKGAKLEVIPEKFPSTKDVYIQKGEVYIASSSGLYYARGLESFEAEHRILNSWCKRLCKQDNSPYMWVGASDGLHRFENGKRVNSVFKGQGVQDMVWVEQEKALYCALLTGRIMRVGPEGDSIFRHYEQTERQVYRLRWYQDELWLATSKGIGRINPKTGKEIWYNTFDGLSSNVVYDIAFQGGYWWLATGNGIQIVPPDFKKNQGVPRLFLRRMRVNQKPVEAQMLQVSSSDEISILIDVLSYYSRGESQLSYSFGGDHWIRLPLGQREFVLSALPTEYDQLLIRVTDAKGVSSPPLFIPLKVHPPYWQSPWFYVGIVVFTFLVVTFAYGLNLKQVKKRQENALEKAQLQTNLITSQLTALKAQMNPHFIFNSLNSIYEMIIFSETKEAANYLNKFAILLRKVLENSEKESLPLNEELEWLTLYLELEKLRFGSDFTYQITNESDEELYSAPIPTMLLQPFVENAVKHGLLHKTGIKRLEISFYERDDVLFCEIMDNGVGRVKAAEFRSRRGETHKSFATGAIQKRIAMLNSSGKFAIELHIDDLEFPDGSAAGTLVKISVRGW